MSENPFLVRALEYALLKWHVFPVQPRGKAPLIPRGHLSASTDAEQIRDWWTQYPDANIGISLKPSRLCVLDVDIHSPEADGYASLRLLGPLSSTLTVQTGSGGLHRIYAMPPELEPSRQVSKRPGLDLLSDGYIVAPPSVHQTGGVYEFTQFQYPAPLPPPLIALHQERRSTAPAETFQEGIRNTAMSSLAGRLRGVGLNEGELLASLIAINDRCQPPLPRDELERIARWASGRVPENSFFKAESFRQTLIAMGVVPVSVTRGVPIADFAFGEDEFDDPNDGWIVPGILPEGSPAIIAGPPKSKKSFLLYHLAICVATGSDVFGHPVVNKGRVLIIGREDSKRETSRRLWRLCRGMGKDLRDLGDSVILDSTTFYLDDPKHVEQLRQCLERYEPKVVFVDNLSRVHLADENDRSAMAPILNTWSDLASEYNCSIVMVHHYRKGDGQDPGEMMRGSGSLFAVVRHVIGVRAEEGEEAYSRLRFQGNLPGISDDLVVGFHDTLIDEKQAITVDYQDLGEIKRESNAARLRERRKEVLQAFDYAMGGAGAYTSKRTLYSEVGGDKRLTKYVVDQLFREGVLMRDSLSKQIRVREWPDDYNRPPEAPTVKGDGNEDD